MPNLFFNPEKCPERVIQQFVSGPSVVSLFRHGTAKGSSDIHCTDFEGKEHVFYIPQHQLGIRRCSVGNTMHILTKVSKRANGKPKYWLMSCVFSRTGYLFPIEAFNEKGEYQPLEAVDVAHEAA